MIKKTLISLLMVFGATVSAADVSVAGSAPVTYFAVIDAGSGGNRIYVYKITHTTPPIIEKKALKDGSDNKLIYENVKPLAGNSAKDVITPLLNSAKTYLLTKGVQPGQVPISVLATAGMRILEDEDKGHGSTLVKDRFDEVRKAIDDEKSGDKKFFKTEEVGVIPGYDEGLYSWLDVNYNNLTSNKANTNGIVEMGGASAQIAFNTSNTQDVSLFTAPASAKITKFTLNGKPYNVFSVSYLGLGQNMARKYMNTLAANAQTRDKCYVGGYTNTAQPALFPDFLFSGNLFDSVDLPFTTSLPDYDFAGCGINYQNVLSMSDFASFQQIKNVDEFKKTNFMGLASIYWRLDPLGMAYLPQQNKAQLEEALKTACSNGIYKSASKSVDCANTTFVYEFLYGPKSLDISENMLHTQDRPSAENGTWTRGYVLYQTIKDQAGVAVQH